ncbi:MAG: tyrosine-type recombinase/integrase [Nitrospira sp.]|nr:tyrosine-type recombinase/integrase [Nitrospira sp.]
MPRDTYYRIKADAIKRVSRSFRTAIAKADIADFRFHDLRHCASTNLRRAGVDTATAMKIVATSPTRCGNDTIRSRRET